MTDRKSGVAFWAAVVVAVALAPGCESPEPTPLVVTPDMTTVVEGNTDFALDLYRQVGKEPGNLFFSPSSLSAALAMTYAGARGETAGQMADTLHFPLDSERLHPAMGALVLKGPGGKAPPYQLHVANALWGQQGYPFLPEFMALTRKHYDAGLHEVDFARATEKARQTINAWAEEQTKRKITDLVPPGVLTTLTRLVLTNAIYFKGTWVYQFDKKKTAAEPFFVTAEESHPLPLMQQKREFNYFQDSDCRVLELPYAGEDISMVVILPEKVDGLAEVEKTLNSASLKKYLSALKSRKVEVYLPRFQMTREFGLKDALSEMGMPVAFSPNDADFTGINGGQPQRLFIKDVLHKAFVAVNEEGTEAAAATGVVMEPTSLPPRFRADHPFIFLIRDLRTGSILFLGRVADPRGEA